MTPHTETSPVVEPLTNRKAWKDLQTHYKKISEVHLRNLFADDPQARRATDGRGRGYLSRLLEEPHHG
jgi:hypothetical protein